MGKGDEFCRELRTCIVIFFLAWMMAVKIWKRQWMYCGKRKGSRFDTLS